MRCSHCRDRLVGASMFTYVDIPQWGWQLCQGCFHRWLYKGRPCPWWASHRWKWTCAIFLLATILLWTRNAFAEDLANLVEWKTCYMVQGPYSWPFRCEHWEYKGRTFWVGFTNSGNPFRVEEVTDHGAVVIWMGEWVPEMDA